jgi:hypothetical protein
VNEIIEKARRLLQLRERAATPGEAQAAARALAKMLDKHRISIAELEMAGEEAAEPMVVDKSEPLVTYNRIAGWRRNLVHVLCAHYGVAVWKRCRSRGWDRRGRMKMAYAMHMCGRQSDMTMVRYMFAWLGTEIERLARQECAGMGAVSHNSWRRGFVIGLDKQLRMARDDASEGRSDAALVLRKRRDDAIDWLRKMIKDLTNGKASHSYVYHDAVAHAAGRRRGEAHHLGEKLDSGVCRALPSKSA